MLYGSSSRSSSAAEPLAAAIIPELVKVFTSSKSAHCQEVVTAAREGGASLDILSGFVAGNFSAFWLGIAICGSDGSGLFTSTFGLSTFMDYSSIFAFGLVAFGFLGMGPVTIAVDSYGPVTDNAQSIYELSLIETIPNVSAEIEKDFGFKPNFDTAKIIWKKMTAPATPLKPLPNRFLSARRSSVLRP